MQLKRLLRHLWTPRPADNWGEVFGSIIILLLMLLGVAFILQLLKGALP